MTALATYLLEIQQARFGPLMICGACDYPGTLGGMIELFV